VAAAKLFTEKAMKKNTTVQEIASLAWCDGANFFRQFKDKSDVLSLTRVMRWGKGSQLYH